MKTIKIIDLLNKIANGEDTPKEIKYDGYTFKKANESYIEEDGDNLTDHICYDYSNLNDEVEIIEEDKEIEKIGNDYYHKTQPEQNQIFQRKINEIIDKVNSLENK